MLARIQSKDAFLLLEYKAKAFLDLIPCAIALWSLDRLVCLINERTCQLTGYSNEEFQENPSLWMNRIHPADHDSFCNAWKKLQSGEGTVSCEYRFFPKGRQKETWLNDTSVAYRIRDVESAGIISAYSDISELMVLRQKSGDENRPQQARQIISGLIHEIRNNMQVIRGELDFLRLAGVKSTERPAMENRIEQINRLMHELDEYFFRPKCAFSDSDPVIILEELLQSMENDLLQQGIRLKMVRCDSLPPVRLALDEFRSALQKVIDFSRALLPQGGELKIEAGLQEIDGERYVKLIVSSFGTTSIPMKEENVFRPFLRINGQSVGLSMVLAQEIVRRHDGKIFFQKEPEQPGVFTIFLRAHSD